MSPIVVLALALTRPLKPPCRFMLNTLAVLLLLELRTTVELLVTALFEPWPVGPVTEPVWSPAPRPAPARQPHAPLPLLWVTVVLAMLLLLTLPVLIPPIVVFLLAFTPPLA